MKSDKKNLIPELYQSFRIAGEFEAVVKSSTKRIMLKGLSGSALAVYHSAFLMKNDMLNLVIMPDKETAAYYYNDLENLLGEVDWDIEKKSALYFPNSFASANNIHEKDNLNLLSRIEVVKRLSKGNKKTIIVTYPEAIAEKTISPKALKQNNLIIKENSDTNLDDVFDYLTENGYDRVEFVVEPGQFSLRGSILDVYSFSNEYPFRIEFFGDEIESLRSFNPVDQISVKKHKSITIFPSFNNEDDFSKQSIIETLPEDSIVFVQDIDLIVSQVKRLYEKSSDDFSIDTEKFIKSILEYKVILTGINSSFKEAQTFEFHTKPQIDINKNFDILLEHLLESTSEGKSIYICSETATQITRIKRIIEELLGNDMDIVNCNYIELSIHSGFIDEDNLIVMLTDHQIFNRYHKFNIRDRFNRRQVNAIQELSNLSPGDYITHIDHGVGKFAGLEKIINNGREQEAMRIVYANNDLLYVNIHSLYKVSKFAGGEGREPKLNRLGSSIWSNLKTNTKKKVKDIAKELIKLYAERKAADGFAFSPDTYMQHELEASFMYEDTPDQVNATLDVKSDMEKPYPMERLICGDVGFGKTEVAVRAAFKAAADSKQVVVLVPTTILAMQHYNTFSARLKDFPVKVDYLNRFRTSAEQKQVRESVEAGKTEILIGTHIVLNNKIKYKDLGLLIIDEEQKFGVAAKEKIKQLKSNIDTLTLSATPIPRTLQFSLMGARDMSILQTPPPNRQPVTTEVHAFDDKVIKDAIDYEINRGGQVFFVHNRIHNIEDVAGMLRKILPGITIAIAHGQMDGKDLEKIMIDFIDGRYDVLLCTKIIESGLDIPNVNTIIINDAQSYGLSELHQLRGRVGRSNKKAFCYLMAPPMSLLTDDARKRLKAIEEFSDLGSGFNIAMRDLDIRGAGNILGAEQSGFISDIGFEVYQKILNEALSELKSENTTDDSYDMLDERTYSTDCQIDTDIEALITDDYVSNLSERMRIYRDINEFQNDEDFAEYQVKLTDRFGKMPVQLYNLFEVLKIKLVAKKLGIERIIFKNGMLKFHFLSSDNQAFYNSETFGRVLNYITSNPYKCRVGDKNGKMTLELIRQKNEKEFTFAYIRQFLNKLLYSDE
ncbi:transcription-repair coupling factor [Bacteroidales bacterium OttesenSCG-928-K03]|nr:transcription-repair coupling factor [Bacteroidales bacterium OttesenSCG-928-K22]MDL2242273.1 transcription-repair coupling factor [Bacteroidales bacterium OttesenSCG-928-K03]